MSVEAVLDGSERWHVINADALAVLRTLPDQCADFVLTDVPYGLGNHEPTPAELLAYMQGGELDTGGDFMGSKWRVPSVKVWLELFRCMKPGALCFSFAGSKTVDLIAMGMRMAGFERRDTLQWWYGQGNAKGIGSIGKAIDKADGAERPVIGSRTLTGTAALSIAEKGGTYGCGVSSIGAKKEVPITSPASEESAEWEGHATGLAPCYEPVITVLKPLTPVPEVNTLLALTRSAVEDAICLLSCAISAEQGSTSSPRASQEETSDSVLENVSQPVKNECIRLLKKAATSGCSAADTACLSIGSSWSNLWDVILRLGSTFTTETATGLTTELRILRSSLSGITLGCTLALETQKNGSRSSASGAEMHSTDESQSSSGTPSRSVPGAVISQIEETALTGIASCAAVLSRHLEATIESSALPSAQGSSTESCERTQRPALAPDAVESLRQSLADLQSTADVNAWRWPIESQRHESVVVCRKPIPGTVVENIREHGVGAYNIDGCRIATDWNEPDRPDSWKRSGHTADADASKIAAPPGNGITCNTKGRWPSNLLLSHVGPSADGPGCVCVGTRKVEAISGGGGPNKPGVGSGSGIFGKYGTRDLPPNVGLGDPDGTETIPSYRCAPSCPVAALDRQAGIRKSGAMAKSYERESKVCYGEMGPTQYRTDANEGTASRFFKTFPPESEPPWLYCPKASRAERELGCEHLPPVKRGDVSGRDDNAPGQNHPSAGVRRQGEIRNHGKCIKPINVTRWLARLGGRPGGLCLVPYCGTGSEMIGALLEGMRVIGVELDASMLPIASARIAWWQAHPGGITVAAKEEAKLEAKGQVRLFG